MPFAAIHAGQRRAVTSFDTLRYRLRALLVLTIVLPSPASTATTPPRRAFAGAVSSYEWDTDE